MYTIQTALHAERLSNLSDYFRLPCTAKQNPRRITARCIILSIQSGIHMFLDPAIQNFFFVCQFFRFKIILDYINQHRASNHIDRFACICIDFFSFFRIRPVFILRHVSKHLFQIHTGCSIQRLHTRNIQPFHRICSKERSAIHQMCFLIQCHFFYQFIYFFCHSFFLLIVW